MKGLKDIKGIVEVPDYSLLYLSLLVLVVLFVLTAIVVWWIQRRKAQPKKVSLLAKEKLKNINFSNVKEAVYDFTRYGHYALNEKNRAEFESILKELEVYKYKKEVETLDSKLIKRMKNFIKEVH